MASVYTAGMWWKYYSHPGLPALNPLKFCIVLPLKEKSGKHKARVSLPGIQGKEVGN